MATTTPPQESGSWSSSLPALIRPARKSSIRSSRSFQLAAIILHGRNVVRRPKRFLSDTGPLPRSPAGVRSFRNGRASLGNPFSGGNSRYGRPVMRQKTTRPVEGGRVSLSPEWALPILDGTFGTFPTFYTMILLKAHDGSADELSRYGVNHRVTAGRRVPQYHAGVSASRRTGLIADVDEKESWSKARVNRRAKNLSLRQSNGSMDPTSRFPLIGNVALGHMAGGRECSASTSSNSLRPPRLRIYRSAVKIDAIRPCRLPAPASYGRDGAGRVGSYYTQGIEEETAALAVRRIQLPNISRKAHMVRKSIRRCYAMPQSASTEAFCFLFLRGRSGFPMLWAGPRRELLRSLSK